MTASCRPFTPSLQPVQGHRALVALHRGRGGGIGKWCEACLAQQPCRMATSRKGQSQQAHHWGTSVTPTPRAMENARMTRLRRVRWSPARGKTHTLSLDHGWMAWRRELSSRGALLTAGRQARHRLAHRQ